MTLRAIININLNRPNIEGSKGLNSAASDEI